MTEYELFKALRPLYPAAEYALLPQVANGTGSRANRHCDALTLSLWPSRGLHLSGFEMKSYRGDWLRELGNPAKAEEIARFCSYWWIVAASDAIVQDGELPTTWGLLVWDPEKKTLKKVKAAPYRDAETPDLPFIAAVLRKSQEVLTPDSVIEEARKEAYQKGEASAKQNADWELRELRELRDRVSAFKKESGIDLHERWRDGAEIGTAVRQVLDGTVMREGERLREMASYILEQLGPPKTQPILAPLARRRKGA